MLFPTYRANWLAHISCVFGKSSKCWTVSAFALILFYKPFTRLFREKEFVKLTKGPHVCGLWFEVDLRRHHPPRHLSTHVSGVSSLNTSAERQQTEQEKACYEEEIANTFHKGKAICYKHSSLWQHHRYSRLRSFHLLYAHPFLGKEPAKGSKRYRQRNAKEQNYPIQLK